MILVLLPGLDGSGKLFSPLLPYLKTSNLRIISLPNSGPQDYSTLAQYVVSQLPSDDYMLLAESFSGPIATKVADTAPSKPLGIIFVASFLEPPWKLLLLIAQLLPLKRLTTSTLLEPCCYRFLFTRNSTVELQKLFNAAILSAPEQVLKHRLKAIYHLKSVQNQQNLSACYIQASEDKLVSHSQLSLFKQRFPNLQFHTIDGPHFILQTKPQECAHIINQTINRIMTE